MKRYAMSCSFGKDSMASLILALEHKEPLDEVVYCEVMFDGQISGEVPEHRSFVYDTAIPFLKREGVSVHIVKSEKTFAGQFQHRIGSRGRYAGKIWSWPLCGRCYVQRDLKARPMEAWQRANWSGDEIVQYIGFSDDETDRIARMNGYRHPALSLLAKYGVTKSGAMKLCWEHGLLSPIYEFAPRNGCFFCPNAKWEELRHLYDCHPALWGRLLELQALPEKATELFTRDLRFDEIDAVFRMDDAQLDLLSEKEIIPYDYERIRANPETGQTASQWETGLWEM